MRLWSLDLSYLDSKGLVALWRETLLARKVLEGKTKGYKNHSQLKRFKAAKYPLEEINLYLSIIEEEAIRRGYNFDFTKIKPMSTIITSTDEMVVTKGQLHYEFIHLQDKLKTRDKKKYFENVKLVEQYGLKSNSQFVIIDGPIEKWEKI